ncbi:hypothetical protein KNJ79_02655 [Sphingopyxis indica]|uniref:DUF6932 family protein n=1 Tax=Sphingopyxis indica TaxID=436663 RepID=UPI002938FCC2|nr:hypothetical protein [Sphingopyxis indica]WOF43874.1 hypothetical protein KNJ79_02655 [Sphingopyxis indica]
MIPALIDLGPPTPWPVLPPGIHDTDFAEIEVVFATTPHRQKLFDGLKRAASALAQVGCTVLYIDGSFVTGKDHPGDFDACWDHRGMDLTRLDPVLLTFANKRAAQKKKYFGEMFWAFGPGNAGGTSFLELFQNDKESGRPKGILRVSLKPSSTGTTP